LAIGAGEIIHKHASINATIEPVGGSTASVNALGAKKIEFAMANSFASSSAFYGKYRFKKKIAIRLLVNGQPNYRSLFVRKSANIKTAQDLVGKIIIGKRRALPENELVMRAMMKVLGLGDDSVRLVATTNSPQMYKALSAGSVDGAIVPYSPRGRHHEITSGRSRRAFLPAQGQAGRGNEVRAVGILRANIQARLAHQADQADACVRPEHIFDHAAGRVG
jgi:TRAP-type uncharacterized transport system substrate-binding protein